MEVVVDLLQRNDAKPNRQQRPPMACVVASTSTLPSDSCAILAISYSAGDARMGPALQSDISTGPTVSASARASVMALIVPQATADGLTCGLFFYKTVTLTAHSVLASRKSRTRHGVELRRSYTCREGRSCDSARVHDHRLRP